MMTDETLPLEKPTILVVDDTPENLTMMSFLLKDRYKVKVRAGSHFVNEI